MALNLWSDVSWSYFPEDAKLMTVGPVEGTIYLYETPALGNGAAFQMYRPTKELIVAAIATQLGTKEDAVQYQESGKYHADAPIFMGMTDDWFDFSVFSSFGFHYQLKPAQVAGKFIQRAEGEQFTFEVDGEGFLAYPS